MTDVKEFTIDRLKWGRGGDDSRLVNSRTGRRCCLGFYGEACGVDPAKLLDVMYPLPACPGFAKGDPAWPAWLFEQHGPELSRGEHRHALAMVNDSNVLDETERENRIAEEFAKHGVTVRFVDGPVSP